MLRLFAGLSLPILLRQRLTVMQGGIEGARWTERENFHITLTFIGEVDEATAAHADEALADIRMEKFSLRLKGTGSFAQGKWPKVLWIGVEESEPLRRLKEKVDRALLSARVPFENRKYTPHVTLARLKNPDESKVAEFMQQHNLFASEVFEAEEFILYHSHLTKNGPAYEALQEYPLVEKLAP
jgi:RNA 2',3'-cyclic 3'-phosphodiesterase